MFYRALSLSLLFTATAPSASAQAWAIGYTGGVQNSTRQYSPDVALASLGITSYAHGGLVSFHPRRSPLGDRPLTFTLAGVQATRQMRTYTADLAEELDQALYTRVKLRDLELSLSGAARVVTLRLGSQLRPRVSFDLGLGLTVASFTEGAFARCADGEPCDGSEANISGRNTSGPDVDPFIRSALYFDSDRLWERFRFRSGFTSNWHVANVSRYRLEARYPGITDAEDFRINRSNVRFFAAWVLPQRRAERRG